MSVFAIDVPGLYQSTQIVESRASDAERRSAFSNAMREVLVKVSGKSDFLNDSQIRRALSSPQTYVDTWAYRSVLIENNPGENAEEGTALERIELEVTFFEPEISRLLDSRSIPVWPQNRPETLVWVVMQEELGGRNILGSALGTNNEVFPLIESVASTRGLPILLPLLDLEDRLKISADQLWTFDEPAILRASARYQSESILIVRLYQSLSGEVIGRSMYLFREQGLDYQSFEDSLSNFIDESINLAATELSGNYGILVSGTNSGVVINMRIDDIDSISDYAALLSYIEELGDVNDYQVASVDQQSINLQLITGGQLRQLIETIALDENMEVVQELTRNNNQIFMRYRWSL